MKQPTKDNLREQLALAADEIIRLRESLQWHEDISAPYGGGGGFQWVIGSAVGGYVDKPSWLRRLWDKCKAACEGDRG